MIASLTKTAKRKGAAILVLALSVSIIPVSGNARKRHAGSLRGIKRYGQHV